MSKTTITKKCPDCQQILPIKDFPVKAQKEWHKDGTIAYRSCCKKCSNRQRHYRKHQQFNISQEQYKAMWISQKGKCIICGLQAYCLDHNHKTGKIRGLLCYRCNIGIGFFKDNPNLLNKAAKYLISFR